MLVGLGRSRSALFWFTFNGAYIRQGLHLPEIARRAAPRISYGVVPALLLWVLGLRAALVRWRERGQDPARLWLFLIGWCGVSVLATTAGGRFFGHYFHQVTAPLAVLAAPGAVRLWRARRTFGLLAVGFPAAVFLVVGLFHAPMARAVGATDPDYRAIAASVRGHSAPDDALVVWGNVPVVYFEADRPLGTRFVFSNYQTGLSPATRTQTDPGADSSANVVGPSWEMFAADLERPPSQDLRRHVSRQLRRVRKVSPLSISAAAVDRRPELHAGRRRRRGAALRPADPVRRRSRPGVHR